MKKLLIDISYWNQELTSSNWEIIGNKVDGVIIRFGYSASRDSWALTYVNLCKKYGLPYAGYWYVYTDRNMAQQVAAIKAAVDELKPCAIFLDYEDTSSAMTKSAQATYYKLLREKVGAELPIITKGVYSGDWYINMFGGLLDWVKASNYWEAAYMTWYEAAWWLKYKLTWGIFDVDKLHEVAEYVGIHNGIMRQIESKIPIIGMPLNLDWNIMQDTVFDKIFTNGSTVPYIPPPYIPFVVNTVLGVNVRSTPPKNGVMGNKIGALPYKTVVNIQTANMTMGWGQIIGGTYSQGWVFLANMKSLS